MRCNGADSFIVRSIQSSLKFFAEKARDKADFTAVIDDLFLEMCKLKNLDGQELGLLGLKSRIDRLEDEFFQEIPDVPTEDQAEKIERLCFRLDKLARAMNESDNIQSFINNRGPTKNTIQTHLEKIDHIFSLEFDDEVDSDSDTPHLPALRHGKGTTGLLVDISEATIMTTPINGKGGSSLASMNVVSQGNSMAFRAAQSSFKTYGGLFTGNHASGTPTSTKSISNGRMAQYQR